MAAKLFSIISDAEAPAEVWGLAERGREMSGSQDERLDRLHRVCGNRDRH